MPKLRQKKIQAKPEKVACPKVYKRQADKPPYTYCGMIVAALLRAPKRRLKLCDILSSVSQMFPAFCQGSYQGWKDSIRHNLSSNDCFVKILPTPAPLHVHTKHNKWTVDFTKLRSVMLKRQGKDPQYGITVLHQVGLAAEYESLLSSLDLGLSTKTGGVCKQPTGIFNGLDIDGPTLTSSETTDEQKPIPGFSQELASLLVKNESVHTGVDSHEGRQDHCSGLKEEEPHHLVQNYPIPTQDTLHDVAQDSPTNPYEHTLACRLKANQSQVCKCLSTPSYPMDYGREVASKAEEALRQLNNGVDLRTAGSRNCHDPGVESTGSWSRPEQAAYRLNDLATSKTEITPDIVGGNMHVQSRFEEMPQQVNGHVTPMVCGSSQRGLANTESQTLTDAAVQRLNQLATFDTGYNPDRGLPDVNGWPRGGDASQYLADPTTITTTESSPQSLERQSVIEAVICNILPLSPRSVLKIEVKPGAAKIMDHSDDDRVYVDVVNSCLQLSSLTEAAQGTTAGDLIKDESTGKTYRSLESPDQAGVKCEASDTVNCTKTAPLEVLIPEDHYTEDTLLDGLERYLTFRETKCPGHYYNNLFILSNCMCEQTDLECSETYSSDLFDVSDDDEERVPNMYPLPEPRCSTSVAPTRVSAPAPLVISDENNGLAMLADVALAQPLLEM